MNPHSYLFPASVAECLALLAELKGRGRVMAGGTDLVLDLAHRRRRAEAVLDLSRVAELAGFGLEGEEFVIRAGATHAAVSRDATARELFPALARACGSVGSPQIRNLATLAGNVVNAQPAADSAVALVALGAVARVEGPGGGYEKPVEELYAGLGQSAVDSTRELLTLFRVPRPSPGQANAFGRIAPRNALCLPSVNAAVDLRVSGGRITAARLCLGPVAARPFRPREAEASLAGVAVDDRPALAAAAALASREGNPRDSCLRGCADYRRQLLKVLVADLLTQALARTAA